MTQEARAALPTLRLVAEKRMTNPPKLHGFAVVQNGRPIGYIEEADLMMCFSALDTKPVDVDEAARVVADMLEKKHTSLMTAKGRNPADYTSPYSTAADIVWAISQTSSALSEGE